MGQPPSDEAGIGLALLGAELRERAGELADGMAARIRAAVPVYGAGTVISDEELRRTCLDNIGFVFGPIGRAPAAASPESRENGRRRAQAGVPLTAVMAAYRVAARYLWDCLADAAARRAVPAGVTLRAASGMWLALDTFTQEMADGYREEITFQVLSQEEGRSAVVQALLEGRLDDANLWEAADILRIPLRGTYVVIAAQVPGPGRHALPQAEAALRRIGVISAWRLLHDAEVGIAWLPGPRDHLTRLADALHSLSPGLVGVSPCYHDLRHTARNLRLARIALRSAFTAQRVTVFDRDLLAVAAGSDPEVMRHVAGTILAALGQIPAGQRPVLLATLGAWLDNGGSASKAASVLFCHPNTVRHRMRRLEQLTGRSLSDPRGIAELSLAFEIDRRDEPPAPEAAAIGLQASARHATEGQQAPHSQEVVEDIFVASSKRYSLQVCLSLAALWSVLGAAACGCYFAVSRLPATQLDGIFPGTLQTLDDLISVVMLPVCLVFPVVLLLAGRGHLRNAAAAMPSAHESTAVKAAALARWMTVWTAVALASVLVEAHFLLRFLLRGPGAGTHGCFARMSRRHRAGGAP